MPGIKRREATTAAKRDGVARLSKLDRVADAQPSSHSAAMTKCQYDRLPWPLMACRRGRARTTSLTGFC